MVSQARKSQRATWRDGVRWTGLCSILLGVVVMMSLGVMIPLYTMVYEFNARLVEDHVLDYKVSKSDALSGLSVLEHLPPSRVTRALCQPLSS